ncbi:MAG: hypothetical protein ACRDD1_10485, partial [Planctomycetia bacterium]
WPAGGRCIRWNCCTAGSCRRPTRAVDVGPASTDRHSRPAVTRSEIAFQLGGTGRWDRHF